MVNNNIVVFGGHYFKDPGCIAAGVKERTYTKIVAQKVVDFAQAESLPVVHGINDYLWHKIKWVNMHHPTATGIVEVHFNCVKSGKAHYTEVIYHNGSYYGSLLAHCIYRQLIQTLWKPNELRATHLGVTTDKDIGRHLGFLLHTAPPAVITESLFLSNAHERAMLATDKVQNKIAMAHVKGINDYLLLREGNANHH